MSTARKLLPENDLPNGAFASVSRDTPETIQKRHQLGLALAKIEGNPLTPEEIAMFEMFDREGWSDERRRAYIVDSILKSEEFEPRPAGG